jgi:transposase, IS30 family
MHAYRRVTYEDRCQISALMQAGFTQTMVAVSLGLHKSTISRELLRNGKNPKLAQRLCRARFERCRRKKLIVGHVRERVTSLLIQEWSPLLIAGRLRIENLSRISHDTIYNFVAENREELGPYLSRFNRRGGGRFCQRKARQRKVLTISERPDIVNRRDRLGDWERDGMRIANHNQLLVCTERKSRYTMIANVGRAKAKDVTNITAKMLNSLPIKSYTMTNDNGSEFNDSANQEWPVYHCEPRRPQQRGSVENTIGLLRRYITRQALTETLTEKELNRIADKLNSRPRRCLDYRTPYEVMFGVKVALAS